MLQKPFHFTPKSVPLIYSALNSHLHSGQCLFFHSQTSRKTKFRPFLSLFLSQLQLQNLEIYVNEFQSNAVLTHDQQNLSLKLRFEVSKNPFTTISLRCDVIFSHRRYTSITCCLCFYPSSLNALMIASVLLD